MGSRAEISRHAHHVAEYALAAVIFPVLVASFWLSKGTPALGFKAMNKDIGANKLAASQQF